MTAPQPCRTFDSELWFAAERADGRLRGRVITGVNGEDIVEACLSCPVMIRCRDLARETAEPYGIWGGETTAERAEFLGTTVEALRGMGSSAPWGEDEDALVRDLDLTVPEIAKRLGRTKNAVRSRRTKLLDPERYATWERPRQSQRNIDIMDRWNAGVVTVNEIAEAMGISRHAVRAVLRRGGVDSVRDRRAIRPPSACRTCGASDRTKSGACRPCKAVNDRLYRERNQDRVRAWRRTYYDNKKKEAA